MKTAAAPAQTGLLQTLLTKVREAIEGIAPGPETQARRERSNLQYACCRLLMELARIESAGAGRKREVAARAMKDLFAVEDDELAPMLDAAAERENRLTSYFKPVASINRSFSAPQKARFVEWLWRVALADGEIDMYEDHLVRKFADLMYVPHADFILAKHRAQGREFSPAA